MMTITAALVKELRERTGLGMMECKKALTETGGDIEKAIELVRISGQAKAEKKASRTAAEGVIVQSTSSDGSVMAQLEVNCETDFVAKDKNFTQFASKLAQLVADQQPDGVEGLAELGYEASNSVETARKELISKIGENISIRRFACVNPESDQVQGYLHGTKIGVVVRMRGGDEALCKDVAMHIAWSNPVCIDEEQVPADLLAKEREIYAAQAADSGKPEEIQAKMVEGKMHKFVAGVTLNGQAFVKDAEVTVGKMLNRAGAKVISYLRYEVGEGIEKKVDDFVAEVMKQASLD